MAIVFIYITCDLLLHDDDGDGPSVAAVVIAVFDAAVGVVLVVAIAQSLAQPFVGLHG